MAAPKTEKSFDPGAGLRYQDRTKRVINKDGSYNVRKTGRKFSPNDLYLNLLRVSWPRFGLIVGVFYIAVNLLFALAYCIIGMDQVRGAEVDTASEKFIYAFFFSTQTFTTVGYGGMSPQGVTANFMASFEAAFGVISLAVITGLLYGRFSKPNARILFSDHALISPYQGGTAWMCRISNMRSNILSDVNVSVVSVMTVETNGEFSRDYRELKLERHNLLMFPLSWTLVHPIDENSPFFGKTKAELDKTEAEVLIIVKAFDDTFSQNVHTRYSYRVEEWLWGMKFAKAFTIDAVGDIVLDLNNIHKVEPAPVASL
jgi:inward rectifier potassium channel